MYDDFSTTARKIAGLPGLKPEFEKGEDDFDYGVLGNDLSGHAVFVIAGNRGQELADAVVNSIQLDSPPEYIYLDDGLDENESQIAKNAAVIAVFARCSLGIPRNMIDVMNRWMSDGSISGKPIAIVLEGPGAAAVPAQVALFVGATHAILSGKSLVIKESVPTEIAVEAVREAMRLGEIISGSKVQEPAEPEED